MSKITKELREALIKKYGQKNLRVIEIPLDEMDVEFIEVAVRVFPIGIR